jgi:hypothetical protein
MDHRHKCLKVSAAVAGVAVLAACSSAAVTASSSSAAPGTAASVAAYALAYKPLEANGKPQIYKVHTDCSQLFDATFHGEPYVGSPDPVLREAGLALYEESLDLERWECEPAGSVVAPLGSPPPARITNDIDQAEQALNTIQPPGSARNR